ncbi:MAG: hypothetical protein K0Q55_3164 [Verrucomicrobia bacterium]|nr:hypothetical protein [Verrucomicrobiota bacterium]
MPGQDLEIERFLVGQSNDHLTAFFAFVRGHFLRGSQGCEYGLAMPAARRLPHPHSNRHAPKINAAVPSLLREESISSTC